MIIAGRLPAGAEPCARLKAGQEMQHDGA